MSVTVMVISCLAVMALAIPFSMVGQGGGSTYVPILLMAGMAMHEASTTSLFMIMVASISATLVFGRKKTVDWKLLLAIAPLAVLGSFAGGFAAHWVSAVILKIIFALVLTIAAFFMLLWFGHFFHHFYEQTNFQKAFDYGDVRVVTSRGEVYELGLIERPIRFKNLIFEGVREIYEKELKRESESGEKSEESS